MVPGNRIVQIESVIRDWLDDPAITLVCGDWGKGSIMEILPEGRAVLTRQRYPEPFSGLREIRLPKQGHHLHLDLGKLSAAVYSVSPCVCYGYKPSFEVRFADETTDGSPMFSLAVRDPYVGDRANRASLVPYFRRMLDHHARYPRITRLHVDAPPLGQRPGRGGWADVVACLVEAAGEPARSAAEMRGPESLTTTFQSLFQPQESAGV